MKSGLDTMPLFLLDDLFGQNSLQHTVKFQILTRLVLKHMHNFSDCL